MSDKYFWEIGSEPPEIEIHSTKKHDVLREYLNKYIKIVGGYHFRKTLNITLVDGFAGGGIYKGLDGGLYDGSPLIFLNSTEAAAKELSLTKDFDLDAGYIFVDEQPQFLAYLRSVLIERNYGSRIGQSIHLLEGSFEFNVEGIITYIKDRTGHANRCIFLLDQYGYSAVPIHTLRRIFSELPKSEVIITLNVDSLIDYLTNNPQCETILKNLGIGYELQRLETDKTQRGWRYVLQHYFYREIVKNSGAKFYTNFFIKTSESHRSYWLLHLSMHMTARNEMQKIHWDLTNHFIHEGQHGLHMLAYRPEFDDEYSGQQSFIFSSDDREINHKLILRELPNFIPESPQPIKDIYKGFCNSSTTTLEMFTDVLQDLHLNRQIDVISKKGNKRREGSKLNSNDLICLPKQYLLYFK